MGGQVLEVHVIHRKLLCQNMCYQRALEFLFQLLFLDGFLGVSLQVLLVHFSSPLLHPKPKWLRLWSSATYKLDASIPILYTWRTKVKPTSISVRKGWSIYRWSGLKSWGLWRDKHAQESKPGWTALSVQGPRGACREVSELACPTHELCHVLKYQSPSSSPGGQNVWCWFCDKILTLSVARQ